MTTKDFNIFDNELEIIENIKREINNNSNIIDKRQAIIDKLVERYLFFKSIIKSNK